MDSEWVSKKASEYCISVRDGTHDSPKEVSQGGKNLVTSRHIKGGILDLEKSYKISIQDFNEINKRSKVHQWDVLFSMIGTIGETLLVKDSEPDFAIKNVGLFKCKNELESQWLYYYLNSPNVKREIHSLSRGTTQQYVPLGSLRDLEIVYPVSNLYKKVVVEFLTNIDEKIELNRKTNETLEGIAKALFKSWFIDFDPIRAKAEGRSTGLSKEISKLFPDSFEDSELGEIPSGWSIESFTSHFNVLGGGTPKTSINEYWNGGVQWFSVVDAPVESDCWVMKTERTITEEGLKNCSSALFRKGTTIISARGTVGKVCLVGDEMAMNQSCYALQAKKTNEDVYCYYSTRSIVEILRGRSHGSVFDTITRKTLQGIEFCFACKNVINAFEESAKPLMEKIRLNVNESMTLGGIRDVLLPKLISGELRVSDAEKMLEEVGI